MNTPKTEPCECGKGHIVYIRYGTGKPIKSCSDTIAEYTRNYGPMKAQITTKED